MYEDLHDKTAVVTGSSKGLGASIAQRLGAEGMNIVVNYHTDEEGARATIRAIEDAGGAGTAIQADVSSEAGIQALRDHALSSFGGIDVWVNNAGVESEMPSDERTVEEWQRVIDVNLTGVFIGSRCAVRHFLEFGMSSTCRQCTRPFRGRTSRTTLPAKRGWACSPKRLRSSMPIAASA